MCLRSGLRICFMEKRDKIRRRGVRSGMATKYTLCLSELTCFPVERGRML